MEIAPGLSLARDFGDGGEAMLNKSRRVLHPHGGRSAALQILAIAGLWLRFAPCIPSRHAAQPIGRLIQHRLDGREAAAPQVRRIVI
jgi:hypothetical protein